MQTRHFGIDTHKRFIVAAAVDDRQQVVVPAQRVESAEVEEWVKQTVTSHDRVVLEVTTGSWVLYDLLAEHAGEVVVANPYKTRLIAEARIKSDKLDALVLAKLLAARFICEVWVPNKAIRQQRQLIMHRIRLARQINQVKNRIHALVWHVGLQVPERKLFSPAGRQWLDEQVCSLPLSAQFELRQLLQQLDLILDQRRAAEQHIAVTMSSDHRMARLMQVTGFGCFTAAAILAAIGDIYRFASPKKLTSYAGLVPSLHQSGQTAFRGSITRAGSPILRWVLVEAAWTAIRFDPHWAQVYDRLRQKRGASIAIVAVARKLLVVCWFLLHDHATYFYLNPDRFVRKLQEWAWKMWLCHSTMRP